jgi:hypothetical protein
MLTAGATGYVGGGLLPRLLEDVVTGEGVAEALSGADVAYYLVHSMGGAGDFAERDRRAARAFGAAAREAGVRRVIYLGGLEADRSAHLRSRHEVAGLLRETGPRLVYARAAMVIGRGSASFQMLEHVVRRLPLMVTPRWIETRSQPVAIGDVLDALLAPVALLSPVVVLGRAGDADRPRPRPPAGRRAVGGDARPDPAAARHQRPPRHGGAAGARRVESSRRMQRLAVAAAALLAIAVALFANARRLLNTRGAVARTTISSPEEHTTSDADGAVRSVQSADIELPGGELDELWSAANLERLARTYWRFLTRISLGLIGVHYRDDGRDICLFGLPLLSLLTFQAPEYELDAGRGVVRWRIEKGLLVSRRGRGGNGFLEIDVRRSGPSRIHVEVEVANFYPAIASRLGRWVYENTQSRIHVVVCYAFLRSLVRLDLAESKVGRFATVDQVPDPRLPPPRERVGAPQP